MVDLSLHILDVATNAFKANASCVKVTIEENENDIEIWIEDDGCGMSREVLENVTNPFFTSRTTRKVGLGIPLFQQTCEQTGGYVQIQSTVGIGTCIHAKMYTHHIDAIPLGDIAESIFVLAINPYQVDVHFKMKFKEEPHPMFEMDTKQIKEILEDVPLTEPSVMSWIKEYITAGLAGELENE